MTVAKPQKPDFTAWQECDGYVYRQHMLEGARWIGGKLVANVCDADKEVSCRDALSWIYSLLSAMDSKASALMRLNGVMLAAAAFLLSVHTSATSQVVLRVTKYDDMMITATAFLSSISILLCLFVVNVSWHFLGKVIEGEGKLDYTEEFRELQRVAKFRQRSYRFAWYISSLAAFLFVLEFARQSIYVMFSRSLW